MNRAMSFGFELISEIDRLKDFPESGRVVPEYRNDDIREIVFRPSESFTVSITRIGFARLRAFGIQREEFHSYKNEAVLIF